MTSRQRTALWTAFFAGCLALFPQGLVPLAMKLSGNIAKVWFLPLHLEERWQ